MDLVIGQLLTKVRQRYGQGGVFNLARYSYYFTLDVISRVAYSRPYGSLEAGHDVQNQMHDTAKYLQYTHYVSTPSVPVLNRRPALSLRRKFAGRSSPLA